MIEYYFIVKNVNTVVRRKNGVHTVLFHEKNVKFRTSFVQMCR